MTVGSENSFLSAVSCQDGKESQAVAVVVIITYLSTMPAETVGVASEVISVMNSVSRKYFL